jgi:GTP cyclohydrolase I
MVMRGVEKPEALTTTQCMIGLFKEDMSRQQQFYKLLESAQRK